MAEQGAAEANYIPCRIGRGELPSRFVRQGEDGIASRDISPRRRPAF
ncbi:MAG: hypothetical protein M3Q65_03810 [Chloroflexota bacterium]|nr:hypothetical protein [Chloroflexota bacterium]